MSKTENDMKVYGILMQKSKQYCNVVKKKLSITYFKPEMTA
jgi:hypothetical protein